MVVRGVWGGALLRAVAGMGLVLLGLVGCESSVSFDASACEAQSDCDDGLFCVDNVCTAETPDEPTCSVDDDCNFSAAPYCVEAVCVNCKPDCEGKECGDDGCGGECGVGCPAVASECNAITFKCEAECTPACEEEGLVCGDDGCGGKCGDCDSGLKCDDGQCLEEVCAPGTTICTKDGSGTAPCNDHGTGPLEDESTPCDEDFVCEKTPDGGT
ncbi:MAG: hypothetical protein VX938_02750, partial [Myxococcota bacterium]|nr:hypothetical protein [Myxococcota bacterium]